MLESAEREREVLAASSSGSEDAAALLGKLKKSEAKVCPREDQPMTERRFSNPQTPPALKYICSTRFFQGNFVANTLALKILLPLVLG